MGVEGGCFLVDIAGGEADEEGARSWLVLCLRWTDGVEIGKHVPPPFYFRLGIFDGLSSSQSLPCSVLEPLAQFGFVGFCF